MRFAWGVLMREIWRKFGMSPKTLVFAPLTVLTLIFCTVTIILLSSDLNRVAATSIIVGGIALYGASAALLCRAGLSKFADLEHMGMTDSLSELPNRRAMHADVREAIARKSEVAVALVDLDGFKLVNDLYGHAVGDKLIRKASDILLDVCGSEARPFRLGGDEFAIIVTDRHRYVELRRWRAGSFSVSLP